MAMADMTTPCLRKMPAARILRALVLLLAVLLLGLAVKTYHNVTTMHADRDALGIWNIVQFEADYRDLVLASHNARSLARIWPARDLGPALGQLHSDLADFDRAAQSLAATLHRNDIAQDFGTQIAQLGVMRMALRGQILALAPGPAIAPDTATLHRRIADLGPVVRQVAEEASQRLMARAAALTRQEQTMRAAMSGISVTMLAMAAVAIYLATSFARSTATADAHGARKAQLVHESLNAVPLATLICDIQGRVLRGNRAAARMLGRSGRGLQGLDLGLLLAADDAMASYRRALRIMRAKGDGAAMIGPLAILAKRANGAVFPANAYLRLVQIDADQPMVVVFAQAGAGQADGVPTAEDYKAAQERFLATMSHELRTPLHGVRAALDLLARQSLPGAAERLVAVAQQSCSHALAQSDRALNALRGLESFDPAPLTADPIAQDRASAITVPLHRAEAAGDATPVAVAQGGIGAGQTALVVDDARVNCDLVAQMLGQLGYRADIAFCGAEAVRMAQATAYELIVLDFEMPGMTGPEAALQITQAGPSARARIIGMTARVDLAAAHRGLPPGMGHVLIKPFGIAELEACLSGSPSPHAPASFAPCEDEMALLRATLEMCGDVLGMALLHDTLGLAVQALAQLDEDPASCAETAHRAAGAAMMAGFHDLGGALQAVEQAARAQADQRALAPLGERLAMATRKAQATLMAIGATGTDRGKALAV
jgi:CheY-like chemotaxis protein